MKRFRKGVRAISIVGLASAVGCPSAVIEAPEEGQAFNAEGGVADVPVAITFEADPRSPIDPATFEATLEEVHTGVADIGDVFAVDEEGADATLVELPVGTYVLSVRIASEAGLDGEADRGFTVQSDKATFVGGTNALTLGQVTDGCFLGVLSEIIPPGQDLGVTEVPSYAEIEADGPITVTLPLPEPLDPFDVQLAIVDELVTLVDGVIPVFDTGPVTGGEVTCLVGASYGGVFNRTSDTTVDAVVSLSDVTLGDPPGQTCNLPQPSDTCTVTLRLDGVAF